MIRMIAFMTFFFVISLGFAFAFQAVDQTAQTMLFTGGPGFPPVDQTAQAMMFTGQ